MYTIYNSFTFLCITMVADYVSNANDSASDSREETILQNIVDNFITSLQQHEEYFFAEIEKKRADTNESLDQIIRSIVNSDKNQYMQDTESYKKYKTFTIILDLAVDRYVNYLKNKFIEAQEERTKQDIYSELSDSDLEVYKNEISATAQSLIDQYFFEQGIATTINDWEKKKYTQQARGIFLLEHKNEIKQGSIDPIKLSRYLHGM